MAKYRNRLPQLAGGLFATDGGLETTLIFHQGFDLPAFAAFVLLDSESGRSVLREYYRGYADIARQHRMGLVLESPTWRANRDWGEKVGVPPNALARINCEAIELLVELREELMPGPDPVVISGNIGPRGDGYVVSDHMSADEAAQYHREQIETFARTEADMVAAFTLNYVEEAVGIAHAARESNMPVALSFTVETDGRLPDGHSLQQAIERTDQLTAAYPAYYMINCAHPSHFAHTLTSGNWLRRLRGVRANASRKSHKELDEALELDAGEPLELAEQYRSLCQGLPALNVVGGCCGTDQRHVSAICRALARA